MTKYIFSGHETFQCRQLWLKKGYDYVKEDKKFTDNDAVVRLGVGKNMVSSIRFWLKAFNVIDKKDNPTAFGEYLFNDDKGRDPFLEDEASPWLLHYQLVKNELSSIYSLIFNEFRKEKQFFKEDSFLLYLKRLSEVKGELNLNPKTVSKDFTVFTKIYENDMNNKDVEESYSGILSEIELLKSIGTGKEKQFFIENEVRDNLPYEVVLFAILDNPNYGSSISLNSLEYDFNSPGAIFALNHSGLIDKITDIVEAKKEIVFSDHAGIKELQFKSKPNPYKILDEYYEK